MAAHAGFQAGSEQIDAAVDLIALRLCAVYAQWRDNGQLPGTSPDTQQIEQILSGGYAFDAQNRSAIRQAEAVFRRNTRYAQTQNVFMPLEALCEAFSLTQCQRFLLMLAMAVETKMELWPLISSLQTGREATVPTLGLGLMLYSMNGKVSREDVFDNDSFFKSLFMTAPASVRPLEFPLRLAPRVMEYMTNPTGAASCLQGIAVRHGAAEELPPIRFYGHIANDLAAMENMAEQGSMICLLQGDSGCGKRLILRHMGAALQKPVLLIDLDGFMQGDRDVSHIVRECRLYGAVAAVHITRTPEDDMLAAVGKLRDALSSTSRTLWLLCEQPWPAAPQLANGKWGYIRRQIPTLTATQRREYWQSIAGMERFAADFDLLSNKYAFTPGMMERAFQDACRIAAWTDMQGKSGDEILSLACRQQLAHNMGSHATLIDSPFRWDDLVLPEDKKAQLYSICAQVRNHHTVFDQWEFAKRIPYGQGLSALFTGPPGTGKTMAAQVLATHLGIEMYQINLSAVVSKYIGETEKNLELVFNEGAKSRCILFFDEADALFAKRTELKDANDRFANAESAYLLQRIENYQGIVILATNYAQNFDPAFRRRIKFTIEFPIPDEASRLLMWKKILAPPVPVDERLDLELIASRFELTGSAIKNIAMNAAFFAAQEGISIGQSQMQQALRIEYAKSGRVVEHTI